MRRIVMFNRVTGDGYFSDADGKLDWVVPDEDLDKSAAERTADSGAGTILLGRRTYEMFEQFWPHVDGSSAAKNPHGGGPLTPEQQAMGKWIYEATKIVVSRTRKDVTWRNSRLLHELDPGRIKAIKREPGSDIMIFGSGSIVSQLTEQGMIDEYQFVVCPILLGTGRPLVSDVSKRLELELLEAKKYPSGNVLLRYEPKSSG